MNNFMLVNFSAQMKYVNFFKDKLLKLLEAEIDKHKQANIYYEIEFVL